MRGENYASVSLLFSAQENASHRNVVHLRPDGKITIEKVSD